MSVTVTCYNEAIEYNTQQAKEDEKEKNEAIEASQERDPLRSTRR